jgi:PPOX class probable F420-dependent enzyme
MGTPLDKEQYVNLETFKKDGGGVKTPVWAAPLDGKLVVGTDARTYKVKRVRNNPKVRVAACNASGQKILGPWMEGTARVLDASEAPRADAALNAKYGWQRRTFEFFAKLVGRIREPVYIEITLSPP